MTEISDQQLYVEKLRRPMYDKLFFVDKLPSDVDCIVDFGCADGSLIRAAREFLPEVALIGYDINPEMIERAIDANTRALLFSDWNDLQYVLSDIVKAKKPALILSSVIHEVLSYGTYAEVSEFWSRVRSFPVIAIRDMAVTERERFPGSLLVGLCRLKLIMNDARRVSDFEVEWGKIETEKALLHLLLKWQHKENWNREVKEDYIPIEPKELIHILDDYEISYRDHRVLPYLKEKWNKELGINVNTPTHLKLILTR